MQITDVSITSITVPPGHRRVSTARMRALARSILDVGLLQPIGLTTDRRLIYGRHRLEACSHLGHKTIAALIHETDELHVELATIDENLQRSELSAFDRIRALVKRKELYVALHPETKHGCGPGRGHKGPKKSSQDAKSFTQDTAEKTGQHPSTIARDVAIGRAVTDEAADLLKDTPVANNKKELAKLAKLPPEEQKIVAECIAEGDAKNVTEALRSDDEPEANEGQGLWAAVSTPDPDWESNQLTAPSADEKIIEKFTATLPAADRQVVVECIAEIHAAIGRDHSSTYHTRAENTQGMLFTAWFQLVSLEKNLPIRAASIPRKKQDVEQLVRTCKSLRRLTGTITAAIERQIAKRYGQQADQQANGNGQQADPAAAGEEGDDGKRGPTDV